MSEEKKTVRIYIGNGDVFRDEDGKTVKRTGYASKIAARASREIRNGRDVELTAISERASSNMVKALVHIFSTLRSYNITPEVKNIYFKETKVGNGNNQNTVMSKNILIGRKD